MILDRHASNLNAKKQTQEDEELKNIKGKNDLIEF